jgi:hypothetical protein
VKEISNTDLVNIIEIPSSLQKLKEHMDKFTETLKAKLDGKIPYVTSYSAKMNN